MKIRSLLLGSVAAAGLATGAYAADPAVLTSLDVCDALGISGLTLSSDTNCLQITGGVLYEFNWGDYEGPMGLFDVADDNDDASDYPDEITDADVGDDDEDDDGDVLDDAEQDWHSNLEAYLKVIATADSDFGPAKAVITLKQITEVDVDNEGIGEDLADNNGDVNVDDEDSTNGESSDPDDARVVLDEAYVSIGDSTVIMAGKKGSIGNFGQDAPFNYLGLFNSSDVDVGVAYDGEGGDADDEDHIGQLDTGGTVIQVTSDLGNGFSVSAGLENLADSDIFTETGEDDDEDITAEDQGVAYAGTLVGVIDYKGEAIQAHVTGLAGGVLDGEVENYAVHAGFVGTFDQFKVTGAFAANDTGFWNALASAQADLDMFTIAVSGEATHRSGDDDDDGDLTDTDDLTGYGAGASIGFAVTDDVKLNVGGRFFDPDQDSDDDEVYQVSAQLVAAVTETLTLTGEIGVFGGGSIEDDLDDGIGDDGADEDGDDNVFYGQAKVEWAPGGGFTSSLTGTAYSDGAYKAAFKAGKTFE